MLQLKDQDFALAPRSFSASGTRPVWKRLIPNLMGPITLQAENEAFLHC